jgi:hypothetical protein
MRIRSISLAIVALALMAPARADTTYTYTGNAMTYFPGSGTSIFSPCAPTACALEVQFTVPQPLGPNLFDQFINPDMWFFDVFVTSIHFSILFADESIDPLGITPVFVITTDSGGHISNWGLQLKEISGTGSLSPQEVLVISNPGEDVAEDFMTFSGLQLEGQLTNAGNPGTWTSFTTGPSGGSVPEPSSLMLLAVGALGVLARRKRIGRS